MPVTISYGADSKIADLEGLTAEQAREEYAAVFNIPTESNPVVNGEEVGNDYVLKEGDKIEFTKEMKKRW